MRKLIVLVVFLLIFLGVWNFLVGNKKGISLPQPSVVQKVVTEESVVIDAVKKEGPSVVTVAEEVVHLLIMSTSLGHFLFLVLRILQRLKAHKILARVL